ncbi:hypothetical protein RHSIM_Rhsim10G0058500 [Rhododendron simsii]|uniref:Sulfotransferase n=1 Tax=Rhododendron simsii TaxID=118357 RepID=A0A834LAT8_RHOSS|nr:hypothetical protein RHSIM_Rhsim10G0058500 [Rhododendron simsii]
MEAQSSFKARDDDVLLASSMKTGTTWLKALIPCIMDPYARLVNDDDDGYQDPLIQSHPNELIPSLEIQIFAQNSTYEYLRPFGKEEEVDKILWRSSFERLKNLEVNRNGVDTWAGFPKTAYFRLGVCWGFEE